MHRARGRTRRSRDRRLGRSRGRFRGRVGSQPRGPTPAGSCRAAFARWRYSGLPCSPTQARPATGRQRSIAAFVGGLAFGTAVHDEHSRGLEFVTDGGELLSIVVWFLFGTLLVSALGPADWRAVLYAALSLTVCACCPLPSPCSALDSTAQRWESSDGSGLVDSRSVVFRSLPFDSLNTSEGQAALAVIATVVLFSVVAHGISASPIATWYGRRATALETDWPNTSQHRSFGATAPSPAIAATTKTRNPHHPIVKIGEQSASDPPWSCRVAAGRCLSRSDGRPRVVAVFVWVSWWSAARVTRSGGRRRAVCVRRRARGGSAMRFTAASAQGMVRSRASAGIVAVVETPRPLATWRQTRLPMISPAGMPMMRPTVARVVACQAMVARIWWRSKPSVLRTASSRRRRRTLVTRACPTASRASDGEQRGERCGKPVDLAEAVDFDGDRGSEGSFDAGDRGDSLFDGGELGPGGDAADEVEGSVVGVGGTQRARRDRRR